MKSSIVQRTARHARCNCRIDKLEPSPFPRGCTMAAIMTMLSIGLLVEVLLVADVVVRSKRAK